MLLTRDSSKHCRVLDSRIGVVCPKICARGRGARSRRHTPSYAVGDSVTNWLTSLVNYTIPRKEKSESVDDVTRSAPKQPPKRDFLEARQVSVYTLVDSDEFKFDVPIYQRPYSWRTKQVYELLQDLLAAYKNKQEYFLGAIVATRSEDGSSTAPYELIDGQQRLTTLMMMIAYLQDWAANGSGSSSNGSSSTSLEVLQLRVRRMLYLEADPLAYSSQDSQGRYRLRLQGADDAFFRANVLDAFLPVRYCFAGIVAAAASAAAGDDTEADDVPLLRDVVGRDGNGYVVSDSATEATTTTPTWPSAVASSVGSASPVAGAGEEKRMDALENETWWRMYENASFMRQYLREQEGQGLNVQEFMFHCLRNCYLVLMIARDEEASFRIFSTLNGRGMDLSVIDKLKADLLQVLNVRERRRFAASWAEMESLLGRPTFHRVFDYMRALASASDPTGKTACLSVSAYFTRQLGDAAVVAQLIQAALAYSSLLLQLRQARWSTPSLDTLLAHHVTAPATAPGGVATVADKERLEADKQAVLEAQFPSTAALLRRLATQSRYMNLFADDAWMPAVLEFCRQCDDLGRRLRFMEAVEALQLHLELQGNAAAKAERWRGVVQQLVQQPPDADAALDAVALTPVERALFRTALDSKDYGSLADPRTTKHLLLRAEELGPSQLASLHMTHLHLDKVAPQHAPDGSQWRKNKLTITHPQVLAPQAAAPAPGGGGGPGAVQPTSDGGEAGAAAGAASQGDGTAGGTAAEGSDVEEVDAEAISSSARVTEEVKYWYEVQRVYFHNTLGNLALLPMATAPTAATADYIAKAALYRDCGGSLTFPRFTGAITSRGKYGAHCFSFEECRARHADVVNKLVQLFGL